MNLFEMCIIATPVFGAAGGGTALKNSGVFATVSGVAVGACVGISVVALTLSLFRMLAKRHRPRAVERHKWIAPLLVVVVIPISLPMLALALSHLVVSAGLHL